MITVAAVRRIGNSFVLIIPLEMIKSMGLQEGSEVILQSGSELKVTPTMIGDKEFVSALNSVMNKNEKILRSLDDNAFTVEPSHDVSLKLKVRP